MLSTWRRSTGSLSDSSLSENGLSSSLRKQIAEHGAAAESALLEIIGNDALFAEDARGLGYTPIHALKLLGDLRSTAAISRIIEVLTSSDSLDVARGAAYGALKSIGAPVLEPCLAAYAATVEDADRVDLSGILSDIGVRDERIYSVLLEELARDPESGAGNLASYGDSRALPHLSRALDEYQFVKADSPLANHVVIELCSAIEDLGGQLTDLQIEKRARFLSIGERWRERLLDLDEHNEDERPKLGRNDPCHCGSGKKYKKCHLFADESDSRA